ncbi:MAG: LLM class flavin-dependent oxidoreductase [Pseudomonadota bacterium]
MTPQVKIGAGFGLWRLGMPSAETIARVAERAEGWGLDSFWLSDHLLAPSPELDVVATLSLIASRTARMKLGPSVLLLNLRHPLMAAKSFASLDYLSGGRMVMAVGTGSNLADYAACGISPDGRGKRLDEGIEVMRAVWKDRQASYHGRFFNFDNVTIEPRPVARSNNDFGTMDIWIGGRAESALRRTARLGDGFFASFQTPGEYEASMAQIRAYAIEYGRVNARIESGLILLCRVASSRDKALKEMQPMLSAMGRGSEAFLERSVFGSAEDIVARLGQYIAKGLDKFVLWPIAAPDSWDQQIELVGREIAAHYARAA